jgi:hypothetical protein
MGSKTAIRCGDRNGHKKECGFNVVYQPIQCSLINDNRFMQVTTKFTTLAFVNRLQRLPAVQFIERH